MIRQFIAATATVLFLSVSPALADQNDPALTSLFQRLKATKSDSEAHKIEQEIVQIWGKTDSDAINYLMQSGYAALSEENYDAALAMFEGVTEAAPDFAEGWSKRATIYFMKDDLRDAVVALEHVLALEPRHFDALYGLSSIFEQWGDKKRALAALEAAQAINPHIEGLAARRKILEKEVEGQRI